MQRSESQCRTIAFALAAASLTVSLALPALSAPVSQKTRPAAATPSASLVPIATGLDNPRHMHFGNDGALYVAEAGRGGGPNSTVHYPGQEGATQYYGATGAVTRISQGVATRIVNGLPSAANADGSSATGPSDVYPDFGLYVLNGGVDPATRATLAAGDPTAKYFNDLLLVLDGTSRADWITVTDFAAYEGANNPDGQDVNSNPYGLAVLPSNDALSPFSPHFVVTDAGGNDVLDAAHIGSITTRAVIPGGVAPYMGHDIPYQSVPTSVAVSNTGDVYVGQLTGFPYPLHGADIYLVRAGYPPQVITSGFTNIVSMAVAPNGDMYALDLTTRGLASSNGPGTGALYRFTINGSTVTKTLVISSGLSFPTGVAIGPDGTVYVANYGTSAGTGEVDRIVE